MNINDIFSNLLAHTAKGLDFHNQLANGFLFLNLKGYQALQEYRYLEESQNYRKLQNFYLNTYSQIIPNQPYDKINLIPNNWYKYTKMDVDTSTKKTSIRDMMKSWVEWEQETNKLLEQTYKELYDLGEIRAVLYIEKMLKDNNKELIFARELYINLETIGYDISLIIDKQNFLQKKYEDKK